MFVASIGRWTVPFLCILLFEGVALAWQGRSPGAWGSGFCPNIGGWAGGWLGILMSILFWVLVCLAIVHLIRRLFYSAKLDCAPMAAEFRPLDILKARYARGEITVEEFQRMKKDLL